MFVEKLHIVLAEDDRDDRNFFKIAFCDIKIQHTLNIVEDGVELMTYLEKTAILPHIIFLDLTMPGKSGLECLKEIRANSKLSDIAIAIYSTSSSPEYQEETFIAGANIYIKKPNDIDTLRKIISDVIYLNWQYITDGLDRENFMISF